jgi:pimeloyl-ACP methyl ester carboxylesterase
VSKPAVHAILTHGYGDSSATWTAQLDAFGRSAAIDSAQAWDLPGHGERRGDPTGQTTMATAVAELAALAAGSPRPLLVGHSAGGYLSLRATIERSIPAIGLVLMSTGPGYRRTSEMSRWNDSMGRLTVAAGLAAHAVDLVTMVDSLVIDHLGAVETPVLVISGDQDRPAYLLGSSYLARTLPNVRSVSIAGAGHDPQRSHPERVNQAVLDFVVELGRDAGDSARA